MNKMSLTMKLGMGFAALLAITLAVAGTGYRSILAIDEVTDVAINHLETKSLSNQIDSDVNLQLAALRGYLLNGEEESLRVLEQQRKQFTEHMDAVAKRLGTQEGKQAHVRIQAAEERYTSVADQEVDLRRKGQTKEAVALAFNSQTLETTRELRAAIEDFQKLSDKLKDQAIEEQNARVASAKTRL
jgi:methyl-accepting chemotaxis protein